MPTVAAFQRLHGENWLNMNGGDGQFDRDFPSYAYLSPLGRQVGPYFQVFSANANDNIYSNGWLGPYWGFRKVIETFEHTREPIIIKPLNVYYHFFSAERLAGLQAIIDVIDWALKRPIAPVFPSVYIRSVLAYREAKIQKINQNHFKISAAQNLHTLRIDHPGALVPDLGRSSGILGYDRHHNSLYIHLNPSSEGNANLFLTAGVLPQLSNTPYLAKIGGLVSDVRFTAKHSSLIVAPFTRGPLDLANAHGKMALVRFDDREQAYPIKNSHVTIPFDASVQPRTMEIRFE